MGKKPLDPRWAPEKEGRISWRRDETKEDWEVRRAAYSAKREEKQRERERQKKTGKPPHEQRLAGTILTLQEVYGLDLEEIRHAAGAPCGYLLEDLVYLTDVRGLDRGKTPWRQNEDDGLGSIREGMFLWIAATYESQLTEALCPLDCFTCPSAQLLNCAVTNRTAAEADGFGVPV